VRHLNRYAGIGSLGLALSACVAMPLPQVMRNAPPDARPGACYVRDTTPATVETATRQIEATPPIYDAAGQITQAATYRTEVRQNIVQSRRQIWFETPCFADMTPDFIASLQRALIARELLTGAPTGMLDSPTRAAIRAFQADTGPNSGELSMQNARRLGLVTVPRKG